MSGSTAAERRASDSSAQDPANSVGIRDGDESL